MNGKSEKACEAHARSGWKLQDLPARQLCPPSSLLLDRLVSIVQEAQFAGEEAGVASQLAPRQLPAASCSLARLSESVRRGEGSVKGEGEGEWVSQREREREREGEGGRVLCEHKSTCHNPSSQPALETAPNQQLAPV